MSYNVRIGEAELYYEIDNSLMRKPETPLLYITVEDIELDDAPDISDSRRANLRSPGTSQLHHWASEVGLHDLFFNENYGLYDGYTNYRALANWHLSEVRNARVKYEETHHNCKQLIPLGPPAKLNESIEYDWDYGKLLWYEFWIDWALKNCKIPIIVIL